MNMEYSSATSPNPSWRAVVPTISIISPTYNEKSNIRPLVNAIAGVMAGHAWELIIVDDDSPDGTCEEARAVALEGQPVRCIRRIGRRGLASAVVEGALASHAEFIAVIDADMQHDERALPRMLDVLQTTDADLVIGSRYVDGGGLGEWEKTRQRMSRFATWCSTLLIGTHVSDPMSGFFAMRHSVFQSCVYNLSQQGYKILLDIMTSAPTELKIVEISYVFRDRLSGKSKLDIMILAEYLFLLIEKLTRGLIPPKFVLFSLVGGIGLLLHLTVLQTMGSFGFSFLASQSGATVSAMTLNYVINNSVTYRNQRLKGWSFLKGYFLFCLVCSTGAVANIGVANLAIQEAGNWPLAGITGALMSAVFNFGVATQFVWGRKHRSTQPVVASQRKSSA